MYIPIMKNRQEELRVISNMNNYFNNNLIPLVEIFRDEHIQRYETDPETGEYVYEKKSNKKRRNKVKLEKKDEDIITLDNISGYLGDKKAFIDFFRFNESEYGNKTVNVNLSFRLSRDYEYYRNRLYDVGKYENLIPTISIKPGFSISEYDLNNLIQNLKSRNTSIGIRITDDLLDDYSELLEEQLDENDYLLFDIRNKTVDSKIIELEELQELEVDSNKILLNSPRSSSYKNGDYENKQFTPKIDNKVATEYINYEFDGFGDYGGLKDSLPQDGGGNGSGAALALIYVKNHNAFFSVVNHNTNEGVRGYKYVRDEILNELSLLDPKNDCIAIDRIKNMTGKYGSWKDWNNIALTRYIQQQSQK